MCIKRFRDELTLVSGLIAAAIILAVGVAFYFTGDEPGKWLALGAGVIFFALFSFVLVSSWPSQEIRRMRILIGLLILNLLALLALPPHLDVFVVLFFVLSVTAASMFDEREWPRWLAGFAVITIAFFLWRDHSLDGLLSALIYIAGFYFFAIFARSLTEARQAETEIKRLYEQLQVYARQVEEMTVIEERNRMAREMHDNVGHRLTVAAVQLEAAQKIIDRDPQRAKEVVGVVREQVLAALDDLRGTVAALRSPVEEDMALDAALQRLGRSFQQATAINVSLSLPPAIPADIPASHRKAIYRAAQETLTNVHRHARAQHVWMHLTQADEEMMLIVEDDGQGMQERSSASTGGFGLRSLQERARQLDGDFHLEPRTPRGSRAVFMIRWQQLVP